MSRSMLSRGPAVPAAASMGVGVATVAIAPRMPLGPVLLAPLGLVMEPAGMLDAVLGVPALPLADAPAALVAVFEGAPPGMRMPVVIVPIAGPLGAAAAALCSAPAGAGSPLQPPVSSTVSAKQVMSP